MRTIGALVLLLASSALAEAPTFQPVGTNLQLMKGIVIPSSNVIFNVPSQAPKDDAEWTNVQNNALMLAEAGNLLMMTGRAKDNGEWMKDARALVDAGTAAFKAANAKDVNKLGDAGDDILTACETCHNKYKPDNK